MLKKVLFAILLIALATPCFAQDQYSKSQLSQDLIDKIECDGESCLISIPTTVPQETEDIRDRFPFFPRPGKPKPDPDEGGADRPDCPAPDRGDSDDADDDDDGLFDRDPDDRLVGRFFKFLGRLTLALLKLPVIQLIVGVIGFYFLAISVLPALFGPDWARVMVYQTIKQIKGFIIGIIEGFRSKSDDSDNTDSE